MKNGSTRSLWQGVCALILSKGLREKGKKRLNGKGKVECPRGRYAEENPADSKWGKEHTLLNGRGPTADRPYANSLLKSGGGRLGKNKKQKAGERPLGIVRTGRKREILRSLEFKSGNRVRRHA